MSGGLAEYLKTLADKRYGLTSKERDFKQYSAQLLAGKCVCGRPLIDNRCSPADGGCGKYPITFTDRCYCIPLTRLARVTDPVTRKPVYPTTPLSSLMREIINLRPHNLPGAAALPLGSPEEKYNAYYHGPERSRHPFVKSILKKIHSNMNVIAVFYGGPGSGKSYAAMRYMELADPTFRGQSAIDRIAITPQDVMKWLRPGKLHRGEGLILDESGILMSSRRSASIVNQWLSETFQSNRQDGTIIFLCVPALRFLDVSVRLLCHYTVECLRPGVHKIKETQNRRNMGLGVELGGSKYEYVQGVALINNSGRPSKEWHTKRPAFVDLAAYERKKFESRLQVADKWEARILLMNAAKGSRHKPSEDSADGLPPVGVEGL